MSQNSGLSLRQIRIIGSVLRSFLRGACRREAQAGTKTQQPIAAIAPPVRDSNAQPLRQARTQAAADRSSPLSVTGYSSTRSITEEVKFDPAKFPYPASSTVSFNPTALVTATSVESRGFPLTRQGATQTLAFNSRSFGHLGDAAAGLRNTTPGDQEHAWLIILLQRRPQILSRELRMVAPFANCGLIILTQTLSSRPKWDRSR